MADPLGSVNYLIGRAVVASQDTYAVYAQPRLLDVPSSQPDRKHSG